MSKLTELAPFGVKDLLDVPIFRNWTSLLDRPSMLPEVWGEGRWSPRVEVKDTPTAYVLTAEMPGVKTEDCKVTVTADAITIAGEKSEERVEEEANRHLTERTYGAFQRTFNFPSAVKSDDVDAELKDGVLTVKVTKDKASKARRIEVRHQ